MAAGVRRELRGGLRLLATLVGHRVQLDLRPLLADIERNDLPLPAAASRGDAQKTVAASSGHTPLLRRITLGGPSIYDAIVKDRGTVEGTRYEELLKLPHREFFRRRGEPAFKMVDVEGNPIADAEEYIRYLATVLPQAYCASRDMSEYAALVRQLAAGTITPEQAAMKSPKLRRKESVCPCSKSVRWVDTSGAETLPATATREKAPRTAPGTPESPGFHTP